MSDYTWDPERRRYRAPAGRLVPEATVDRIRNRILDAAGGQARTLAASAVRGEITPAVFATEFRKVIKQSYGAAYAIGRGGRDQMQPADWARVGAEVTRQYRFAEGFAIAIRNGEVTEGQAEVRAEMYTDGGIQAFERGRASAANVSLPAYPGDGNSKCLGRCRCRWEIRGSGPDLEAFWRLDTAAEHCADCLSNAATWSPWTPETG